MTIDCSVGGYDTLHGGEGDVDYIVGGSFDDAIYGDHNASTNIANSDVVFGDHAEIVFYANETHKLQHAITIDGNCSGGSDIITLGPGDDLVSLLDYCYGSIESFALMRLLFLPTQGIWR